MPKWFWRLDASLGGAAPPGPGQRYAAAHPVRLGLFFAAGVAVVLLLIAAPAGWDGTAPLLSCLGVAAFAGVSVTGIACLERARHRHHGHGPGEEDPGPVEGDPPASVDLPVSVDPPDLRTRRHHPEDRPMDMLPKAEALLVVRTDFSDQDRWQAVRAALGESDEDGWIEQFSDQVHVVEDPAYRDLTAHQLLALVPEGYDDAILVVADKVTIDSAEMPFLVIDLAEKRGDQMRVIPSELPDIHANLSISNMNFYEFADGADEDGVFRGFPD